eukprot:170705_1
MPSFALFSTVALCILLACSMGKTPAPIDQRAASLLAKMSLLDKARQLNSINMGSEDTTIAIGMVGYAETTNKCGNNITCRIISRNKFQSAQMSVSPLHIPVSFRVEALHSSGPGGTIFPVPSLLGCTWNRSLLQTIGQIIAFEARVFGIDFGLAPVLQIVTDPRYGRFTESYGSDGIFVSHLGFHMSRGLTGGGTLNEYMKPNHLSNEAKHYLGYAFGGKDGAPFDASERSLREIYLRPWQAFVASGGRSVMAAHNAVNGVPMHANKHLLSDVLRKEWNWTHGLIASDCADISKLYAKGAPWSTETGFHIASDMNGAVLKSMNAGLDLSLCDNITANVLYLMKNKLMNMSVLNRAVSNILHSKYASGLFDEPLVTNITAARINIINNSTARRVAKEAALQGIVLLKNNAKLLPLDANKVSSLGVIGPVADDEGSYYGPYCNTGADVVTIVDALRDSKKYDFTLHIARGCDAKNLSISDELMEEAVSAAIQSDYVLLMVGDTLRTVGENTDRVGLEVPGGQLYLINEILKVKGNKTIVIYLGGRPAVFGSGLWNMFASTTTNGIGVRDNALLNRVNALLSAYHPGEEGGNALLEILFGESSPSGRLSTSWPQSAAHVHSPHSPFLKAYQGHENFNYVYNSIDPLFAFGYGLSYADILHSDKPRIVEVIRNCKWILSVDVVNKSPIAAYEVVQIYYTKWVSDVVRNELELAGFEQVFVGAESTVSVNVTIDADSLSYYSTDTNQWILESGVYYLYDGANAKQYDFWSTTQLTVADKVTNSCKFWSDL